MTTNHKQPTRLFPPKGDLLSYIANQFLCFVSEFGKESACNAGDSNLIPGLGRCPGEGIGYPIQYSWASLVTQLVKNPPIVQETWIPSLGWEDPLEEAMATHSSILTWRIHMDREAWQAAVHGVTESDMTERLSTFLYKTLAASSCQWSTSYHFPFGANLNQFAQINS